MLRFDGICPRMGRPLFAMLIAVAMLFAPLALRSGSAMAVVPAGDHHAQMTEQGPCDDRPAGDSQSEGQSCCAAMCTAIAVDSARPVESHAFQGPVGRPARSQFRLGFLARLPTPPPRQA